VCQLFNQVNCRCLGDKYWEGIALRNAFDGGKAILANAATVCVLFFLVSVEIHQLTNCLIDSSHSSYSSFNYFILLKVVLMQFLLVTFGSAVFQTVRGSE